ncbi:hypothetical protein AB0N23_13345 [Streptomyces sp. NPDC052644]
MTATDRPSRPRLDHMTDDDLDTLYAEMQQLRAKLTEMETHARVVGALHRVAETDLKARDARVADLEAALDRVRRLATDTRRYTGPGADGYQFGKYDLADAVLAALDGPARPGPQS